MCIVALHFPVISAFTPICLSMSLITDCLLIECVSDAVGAADICRVFHSHDIGLVKKIVWKSTTDTTKMCAVFFHVWYDTAVSARLRELIFVGCTKPFFYKLGPFDSGSTWHIRKLADIEFGVWRYPPIRHIDLEVLIDAHVMHESVEDMIDHLKLGKVLSISSNWIGGAGNPRENLLADLPRDPRDMILSDSEMHENERVRIQFKCWDQTPEAARFQYLLFHAAPEFAKTFNSFTDRGATTILTSPSSDNYVRVQVSDCLVLKLYAREALKKATLKHEETFEWVSPEFRTEAPALTPVEETTPAEAPALTPVEDAAEAPVSAPTEDKEDDSDTIELPDLLKMLSVGRKPHGRPEDIPNFLKKMEGVEGVVFPSVAWIAGFLRVDRESHHYRTYFPNFYRAHQDNVAPNVSADTTRKFAYMFKRVPLSEHAEFMKTNKIDHISTPTLASGYFFDRKMDYWSDPFTENEVHQAVEIYNNLLEEEASDVVKIAEPEVVGVPVETPALTELEPVSSVSETPDTCKSIADHIKTIVDRKIETEYLVDIEHALEHGAPSVAWVVCKMRDIRRNAFLDSIDVTRETIHELPPSEIESLISKRKITYMFAKVNIENHENFIEKYNLTHLSSSTCIFSEEEIESAINIYYKAIADYLCSSPDPEDQRAGDSDGAMKYERKCR
jgi:hypothetical protein